MIKKSYMSVSWIIMVILFIISIIDVRFAILGLICMLSPLYFSIKGQGKVHCAKLCPRGSLLWKFLNRISLKNNLPKGVSSRTVKNIVFVLMMGSFAVGIYQATYTDHVWVAIGQVFFRMIAISSILAIILGVIYQPRSWCKICPMGYLSGEITKRKIEKSK